MFESITKCKGCGCDILNIRATKGRLKHWCSEKCRSRWRYLNEPRAEGGNIKGRNVYLEQKRRGYLNKLRAIKSKGGKCQKCGEDRLATLCFHHRDSSQKKTKLDGRAFGTKSWESIEEEVDKCDLLCHNCHFDLHYGGSWDEFFERAGKKPPPDWWGLPGSPKSATLTEGAGDLPIKSTLGPLVKAPPS